MKFRIVSTIQQTYKNEIIENDFRIEYRNFWGWFDVRYKVWPSSEKPISFKTYKEAEIYLIEKFFKENLIIRKSANIYE